MNCPICGEVANYTLDYIGYFVEEEHDTCKHNHWWRDWIRGSSREGFSVNKNFHVDYISDDGGILYMTYSDNICEEVRKLSPDEVDGYLYTAKSLWNKSIEDKGE